MKKQIKFERILHVFGYWILVQTCLVQGAHSAEFTDESEKDYKLRSLSELSITNVKGDVSVQGWALDKIRVKVKKIVETENADRAKLAFRGMDYRFNITHDKIEVSSQYGKELNIEERLQEKENPKNRLDFTIFAPSNLKMKIWSVNGKVLVKSWNATTEVRSNSGSIRIESLKADQLSVLCTACSTQIKNTRASIKSITGDGNLELNNINGKKIYAETSSGSIKLWHTQGEQLYSSKIGSIDGQFLEGKVEFHSIQGPVHFKDISGFLSGTTDSGNVTATVRQWEFLDKALIETVQGNIHLTLPRRFSANVDIWSIHGKSSLGFPFEKSRDVTSFGPDPDNHLIGRVREGGELLKIFTESGNIYVLKGDY